jgi:hypothetical protein
MIRIPKVTMTMRELDRLKCIQGLIDGQLKQNAVATRLGLTTRQVRRLVRQYKQQGPVGLISKLRNRPSNRRLKSDVAEHAFGILRSTYADFGPTLAAEKLRERHGVDLAVETVRSLMVAGGLWLPRRLRAPKIQQPRSRRACLGELVQIDGCDHHGKPLMCANTPAAKGRVERAHQTLQDRLEKELRLQRISSIDAANAFMPTFIEDYTSVRCT